MLRTPEAIARRMESRNSNGYLSSRVHRSTIHKSRKVGVTLLSITEEWVNQRMVQTHHGIQFRLKKEGNPVTCYNIDEP